MPGPRLPLELELYIIDLAVPPRTFYNLPARINLLKQLALVHRAWTARAQSYLRQHIDFSLDDWRYSRWEDNVSRFRRDVMERATGLLRLDISICWEHTDWVDWPEGECAPSSIVYLQELGLRRTTRRLTRGADYASPSPISLNSHKRAFRAIAPTVLDMVATTVVDSDVAYCPLLTDLPRSLRYLSIAHLEFEEHEWSYILTLPHLSTLLLTGPGSEMGMPKGGLLQASALEVLGYKATMYPSDDLPPSLRHFAVIGIPRLDYRAPLRDATPFPTSLESLTILWPPTPPSERQEETEEPDYDVLHLTGRCKLAGIDLTCTDCAKFVEVDDFDLEEWAANVA